MWPRPRTTRHAWLIDDEDRNAPPRQAFVLEWERRGYQWRARVLFAEELSDGTTAFIQQWVPAGRLRPVKADPNAAFGLR